MPAPMTARPSRRIMPFVVTHAASRGPAGKSKMDRFPEMVISRIWLCSFLVGHDSAYMFCTRQKKKGSPCKAARMGRVVLLDHLRLLHLGDQDADFACGVLA